MAYSKSVIDLFKKQRRDEKFNPLFLRYYNLVGNILSSSDQIKDLQNQINVLQESIEVMANIKQDIVLQIQEKFHV